MKNIFALIILSQLSMISFAQEVDQKADSADLDTMIGQMILTGIGDFSYMPKHADIVEEIKAGKVGGVIFFEKNVHDTHAEKQLKRSIKMLSEAASIPLFISIDEEGGRVNRLKPKYGFPETRQAAELGKLNNLDTTAFYATNTASTLNELGFNVNFAPDVDVAINPDNPVISRLGRSYSDDPKVVFAHAATVVDVHRNNKVITALKHFPGHGSSRNDSHLGVADVSDTWQFSELMPYKWLIDSGKVDAIMTAHIVNEHLDASKLPATLSPYIITNILRGVLNYQGVVFTDDMQMHAISRNYGFEESIKMAINAGADVLLFANNVPGNERRSPSEIHKIISDYVASGNITVARIRESYERIMTLKQKIL